MCIVHTVRYAGCEHIHSYAEIVHDNAFYCPNQQVIHDGVSNDQEKCPACVQKDRKLRQAARAEGNGSNPGLSGRADSKEKRKQKQADDQESEPGLSEMIAMEEMVFVENYSSEGAGSQQQEELGSSDGRRMEDGKEWYVVREEDVRGRDIDVRRVEGELVVTWRRGKKVCAGAGGDGDGGGDGANEKLSTSQTLTNAVAGTDGGPEPELNAKAVESGRKGNKPRAREQEWYRVEKQWEGGQRLEEIVMFEPQLGRKEDRTELRARI